MVTDSIIRIGSHIYHLGASPQKDKTMVIRMFEYDISIAIEHASFESNDIWEIEFPQSCVLYIRNHRSLPDFHEAIVKFADGQKNSLPRSDHTGKEIHGRSDFEKRLLILLPYHIYDMNTFEAQRNGIRRKCSICSTISGRSTGDLSKHLRRNKKSHLYMDMIVLIEQIAGLYHSRG